RLCSIYRAVSIHRCSQGRINLTAVNVGVGGREHNPVRPCLSHDAGDLLRVANVRLRTSQSDDLVSAPLPHERFPQHSSRAENEDTHISIMSYLRGRLTVQFCSKLHQYVVWGTLSYPFSPVQRGRSDRGSSPLSRPPRNPSRTSP